MAAPKTVATYDLDGSTREFDFSFDYLSRTFVQVTLIGTERRVLALEADYTFVGNNRIRTSESYGPPDWGLIEIRRVTPTTERLVAFQDASILRADDLNLSDLQVLHVAEEARDAATETIGTNNFGHLDARGRRIVNVGNAVDRQDAFTYGQYLDDKNGTFAAKQAAEAARDKSREWATSPDMVEGTLRSSKYYSEQAASSASASATSAASSDQKATAAANSATAAANSATAAANSATAAANSATAAAASEQAAAGFAGAVQGLVAGATPSVHRFIGDGVQTEFDLGVTIIDPVNALVFLDGANREPVVDYTVDGSVLKFEEAPADGVKGVAFVSPHTALAIGDASNIIFVSDEGPVSLAHFLRGFELSGDNLSPNAEWSDVPKLKGEHANAQAQALVNRLAWLREVLAAQPNRRTVRSFYQDGDSVADTLERAILSGLPLDFENLTYECERPVSITGVLNYTSSGAVIKYVGAASVELFVSIYATGSLFGSGSLTFDGAMKAHKSLFISNDNPSVDYSIFIYDLCCKNVYKTTNKTADCLRIVGGFKDIYLPNLNIDGAVMATGAGSVGVTGVAGVAVNKTSTGAFPKNVVFPFPKIYRVYSEDPSYTVDQDGIQVFGLEDSAITGGVPDGGTHAMVIGGYFEDTMGRAVKIQAQRGDVLGAVVTLNRSTAVAATGNAGQTIDMQTGGGSIENITGIFKGHAHRQVAVINTPASSSLNPPGGTIRNIKVMVDSALYGPDVIAHCSSRAGQASAYVVDDITVTGPVRNLVVFTAGTGTTPVISASVSKLRGSPTGPWVLGSRTVAEGSVIRIHDVLTLPGTTSPVWGVNSGVTGYTVMLDPVLQESATDTTSGRVMTVGAFGLGGSTPLWPKPDGLTDDDSGVGSGFYYVNAGTSRPNNLGGFRYWLVEYVRRTSSVAVMKAYLTQGPAAGSVATRAKTDAGWGPWFYDLVSTTAPEGVYSVPAGSICRTTEGKMYLKTTDSSVSAGWVEK